MMVVTCDDDDDGGGGGGGGDDDDNDNDADEMRTMTLLMKVGKHTCQRCKCNVKCKRSMNR